MTTKPLTGRHKISRSVRVRVIKRLFVALVMAVSAPPMAGTDVLAAHLWQARLLILAAPSDDDPALRQQRRLINVRSDALADRDLRVYELVGDRGQLDGRAISDDDVAALRVRFKLAADDSVMILVGLDGSEKRRAALTTPLTELFLQIDAMPMRRAEIRARRAAGERVTAP